MKTSDICGLAIVSVIFTVMVVLCVIASMEPPEVETEAISVVLFEDPDDNIQNDMVETESDISALAEKLDGIQASGFPLE